jgi:c-di-GMP-binding flagellar brake protein YcgR
MSMLDRNDGTSWMNRDNEVLAHLRVAADELDFVTVEAGRESQYAELSLVPGQSRYFQLHTGGDAVFPSAVSGAVIKVVYERNSATYEFLSVVTERMAGGTLAVAFPQFIERRERRASRRVDVRGGARVQLHTDRGAALTVFDLSTSGLGIVATPEQTQELMSDGIRGVLALTDDLRINVWLDVRHARPLEDADKMFVGARFLGLSGRELSALRNFIEGRLAAR